MLVSLFMEAMIVLYSHGSWHMAVEARLGRDGPRMDDLEMVGIDGNIPNRTSSVTM